MNHYPFITRYSAAAFLFVLANVAYFIYLFYVSSPKYAFLAREDGLVEYAGALLFLSTSVMLFACVYSIHKRSANTNLLVKLALAVAGVVFFVGAGEEVSWGQRIFSIETPEYFQAINGQNELNFHNINKKFFDKAVAYGTGIVVFLCVILHAFRVTRVFKLPLPSLMLIVTICLVSNYKQYFESFYKSGVEFFRFDWFMHLRPEAMLTSSIYVSLVLVAVIAAVRIHEKGSLTTFSSAVIVLFVSFFVMLLHVNSDSYITAMGFNLINEVREYLLAFCCFVYSLELFSQVRVRARAPHDVASGAARAQPNYSLNAQNRGARLS